VRKAALVLLAGLAGSVGATVASPAWAQSDTSATVTLAPDTQVPISTTPPEGKTGEADTTLPTPPPEAPPPRPRRKGLVLESTAGVMGFAGHFNQVAPPALFMHLQLGYELFKWLMIFGEGDLAMTTTSNGADESHSIAFPIWGFGGGLRATIHATERFAFFVQGDVGALTAYVPHDALTILGFHDAEALNPAYGGRVGVEWYAGDRHIALTAQGGVRDATGFAEVIGPTDLPLVWDALVGFRYTF